MMLKSQNHSSLQHLRWLEIIVDKSMCFQRVTTNTVRAPEKQLPGYTVTTAPVEWNLARNRNLRVVEVADTFIGMKNITSGVRYGGRVTLEEVLDSIFHETKPSTVITNNDFSSFPAESDDVFPEEQGIYTKDVNLMQQVSNDPAKAEKLLRNESLYIRCARCHRSKRLPEARLQYVSCKHCYTYYCSKACRELDWSKHSECCSLARINTLCKDVIMKLCSFALSLYSFICKEIALLTIDKHFDLLQTLLSVDC
uniref:MYND-type domain-containing protein n=1 Tax=Syphacia muris TaxID=451379 RepID=A0A0N5B042_9BILA